MVQHPRALVFSAVDGVQATSSPRRKHSYQGRLSRGPTVSLKFAETRMNTKMSDRLIITILLLLSLSSLSWAEHVDPSACPSPTTLRRTPQSSTDGDDSLLLTQENEIHLMAFKNVQENMIDVRGGGNGDSASISLDQPSVESIVYDLNSHNSNGDRIYLPSDHLFNLSSLSFSATQPGDGSQFDPDGIPTRFLLMQKGHRGNAIQALKATKAWREKHGIDTILSRPQPNYDLYKAIFPVFLAGRDPTGHIIVVEQLGKINDELARRKNISMDEVLLHFVFIVEYCWNILDKPPHHIPSTTPSVTSQGAISQDLDQPRSPGTMVAIMDCEGVSISSLLGLGKTASENRKFLLKFVQTISDNYPLRSYKTYIVNAPHWIHGIYNNLLRPLLRESTREKVKLFQGGKEQQEALSELGLVANDYEKNSPLDTQKKISDDLLSTVRKSSMEQELRNFVQEILRKSGDLTMNTAHEPKM